MSFLNKFTLLIRAVLSNRFSVMMDIFCIYNVQYGSH